MGSLPASLLCGSYGDRNMDDWSVEHLEARSRPGRSGNVIPDMPMGSLTTTKESNV